MIDMSRWGQNK